MTAHSRIPVADAVLFTAPARGRAPARLSRWLDERTIAYTALLVICLGVFSTVFYLARVPKAAEVLAYVRYPLWPVIIAALSVHLTRHGWTRVGPALMPFLPFLAIGIFTGVIGQNPFDSARMVLFWLFGVLAAATIGGELKPELLRNTLFLTFAAMLAGSAAFSLALPSYGVATDTRVGDIGVWVGLFDGKNALGEIAAIGLIAAAFVPRLPAWLRIAGAAVALLCLVRSGSQGAIVTAAAVSGYLVLVIVLRALPVSAGLKIALMVGAIGVTVLALVYGLQPLLTLLDRDPTLTGRTSIWVAYLDRAAEHWLAGAGPGSFTKASWTTWDLTLRLIRYGRIVTPHNMYIAAFGETGIFGFFAFVLPIFYCALIVPLRSTTRGAVPLGAFAFAMAVAGAGETHEVFGLGMNMFILILLRASMVTAAAEDAGDGATPRVAAVGAAAPPPPAASPPPRASRIPALGI